jgi:ADP-sugar diphosphatase
MSTFTLNRFATPVKVTLTPNITKKQLLSFQAFNSWIDALQANLTLQHDDNGHGFHDNPYVLVGVEIQSVDYFGPSRIGFIKLSAQVRDTRSLISSRSYGVTLPGITLLRGGSVAVLMILRPQDSRDERWVVLVGQPRIPTGSLGFVEIPAGMLDGEGNYAGKAAEEIQEELGFTLQSKDLVNLTELALKHSEPTGETLKDAMYVSPGGSDETVLVLLWEKVSIFHCVLVCGRLLTQGRSYIVKRSWM